MHQELLLFLSKIKRLSVREQNADPKLNTVNQISITSETDFQMRKNMDAESYSIHLAAKEGVKGEEEECSYYMWRQKFPVKAESRVKKRMEIDEWVITLAFPHGQRLNRGMRSPGVYAFLPTEMVTNLPFIIQADFLLASSRESMLLDSPWNIGILSCVPSAFLNAFVSLVKSTETAPSFSLPPMFRFLPVNSSPIQLLDTMRLSIKEKVVQEHIIPCESYTSQKIFCKPDEVRRLIPAFWSILIKAQKLGVNLDNISSHGTYVLSSSFDQEEYDKVLEFLGVQYVDKDWYGKCLESSHLASHVSEQVYMELIGFLADKWNGYFEGSKIKYVPLVKYVSTNGVVSMWSIDRATRWNERICIASDARYISWLINWNTEFATVSNYLFVPESTQMMLCSFSKQGAIMDWLKKTVKVEVLDVYNYGLLLMKALSNRKDVIAFTHFLYHSLRSCYVADWAIKNLCSSMPLVDNYGHVTTQSEEVLRPAKGSKWVGLIGSNPWRNENYVELGADYLSNGRFAGVYSSENVLLSFLEDHIEVSDIPNLRPPDAAFPTVSSPLTKDNAYLLLEWIRNLRTRGIHFPQRFLNCVKNGNWLKTSIGHKSPSKSFLSSSEWGNLMQMDSVLVDIPMIDQGFYGGRITGYKEELRLIGVRFEFGEASSYIGDHFKSLAANSTLTRKHVFSLLNLIRFLREKHLSPEHLINNIKNFSWLKTTHHYRAPVGSILFDSEWTTASLISNLPFIDKDFYGKEILNYKTELELLGVIVSFKQNHQLVVDNFKLSTTSLPADAAILILECIRYTKSSEDLTRRIREIKWVKTHFGFKSPVESFLADSDWQCLVEVVDDIPLIDEAFYGGEIRTYKEELKKAGVVVRVEEASKVIADGFKKIVSSSFLLKKNVIALLECYRKLKEKQSFPDNLTICIHNEKWLCTRLGFRSPTDSILFDPEWDHISPIAALPFIDDTDSYYGKEIYEYRNELKAFGVVVQFKQGAKFIGTCLNIPKDPSVITRSNVFSLLDCIRNLKEGRKEALPKDFMERINKKWLKTSMGYKSPDECILFDSKWGSFLQREDTSFIDEAFYGVEIVSYRDELKEIGVIVNVVNGCSLLARQLKDHTETSVLNRIYLYLSEFKWMPDNEGAEWVWIPNGIDEGKWVSSCCCVLHDKDNLFGSQLYVLEKHYDKKLLAFFSMVLGVKHGPMVHDYCKLWKTWESESYLLTIAECSAFWVFISRHWNPTTKKFLTESITKLPVYTGSVILLSKKEDIFIPDDLLLQDLFGKASQKCIFIWYPETKFPETSRAKMNNIYSSIGVRAISEAVEKEESSLSDEAGFRRVDARNSLIKNGLLKLILGFLADPSFDICVQKRHEIMKYLLDVEILGTDDPVTMSYRLALSSGEPISVKATRMFRWEREKSKLVMQGIDLSSCMKAKIEFATYFSEVIAVGLLYEREDEIDSLTELIKTGCLLDFESDAVEFLLKTKNLQLFAEDEEFLSSLFSSVKI